VLRHAVANTQRRERERETWAAVIVQRVPFEAQVDVKGRRQPLGRKGRAERQAGFVLSPPQAQAATNRFQDLKTSIFSVRNGHFEALILDTQNVPVKVLAGPKCL
jgi:hypothetical protein